MALVFVFKSIQKLMRDFLYDGMKKFRLVSWEVVGKPVNWDWGVKGLRNKTLLAKWFWCFSLELESLW